MNKTDRTLDTISPLPAPLPTPGSDAHAESDLVAESPIPGEPATDVVAENPVTEAPVAESAVTASNLTGSPIGTSDDGPRETAKGTAGSSGSASDSAPADGVPETIPNPFARVPDALRLAIEKRGFTALTTVQVAALDAADTARDLLITSQTGSGKTVALGLAMARDLLRAETETPSGPNVLVIVPTRELATQVRTELEWLYAAVDGVQLECVTGGTSLWKDRQNIARRPRVLVGTPGRLLDHIRTGTLDASGVRQLVLDEADEMLNMGFREDLEAILQATPTERRTHLVSATFPPGIKSLAKRYQASPLHVEGTRLGAANEDIEHVGYVVDRESRYEALVNLLLLGDGQRTLVFVSTRSETAELADKLVADGFSALALSGDLRQDQRIRTLASFRSGVATVLVGTDVAARGLDVPDVATVIHTGPLKNHEVYTHRSGRTGRAGQKGRSVLFCPHHQTWQTERVLARANVAIEWREIPSAKTVRKTLRKRARRGLWEAIDSGEGRTDELVEHAQRLLESRDAVDVVATLLARDPLKTVREPYDIRVGPRRNAHRGRRNGPRDVPTRQNQRPGARVPRRADGPRGKRYGAPDRPGARAPQGSNGNASYDRFEINFGERAGATHGRLLAMICRRGGVTRHEVGSILVSPESSSVEIAAWKARDFESKMSQRDSRDPWVRVRREGSARPRREAGPTKAPSK